MRVRSRRRRSSGQGLVEFALVVPILMLVLLGAVDFGRLMQARVTAESATRAGASWGAGILANATQALDPVFSLSTSRCAYGPTCNIEARACDEAAGFPSYSGGPAQTGAGSNPVTYHDCANNYGSSANSAANVCSPSSTQSNPFFTVTWRHADGTSFSPGPSLQAVVGDTIEVNGTACFKTFVPWPGVPSSNILTTSARYTVQP
jgi:Flp pilus assembly protein TadG